MNRRKLALLALCALLAMCAVVYGQRRLASRAATVEITDAGAVRIAPKTGQAVSVAGNTSVTGTLASSGNFAVNTNKFTVAASSGNTAVAGTLAVTGAASAASLNLGGATLLDVLTNTASLDFGATAAGTCDALTITVTGATDGDPVVLGVPEALMSASAYQTIQGFVSAADTVTVKRCNLTNATTALANPAAATVRATVLKF